jgi:hypothetical protein
VRYHVVMPSSPASLHDLAALLRRLPAVEPGHLRLFRMQSNHPVVPAPWIVQAQKLDGTAAVAGRWFTSNPQALSFYAQDLDYPQLLTLDVSEEEAMSTQVKNMAPDAQTHIDPRAFSRDPDGEHLVPRDWLNRTQRWELELSRSPRRRHAP